MIKFTAVSIVLYLVNLFMIKVHFKSPSANVRYALDVEDISDIEVEVVEIESDIAVDITLGGYCE